MSITKDSIDGLIGTIQSLFLADSIPWMIGYSGGKDSTATVQLVWMALQRLPEKKRNSKPIYIMNTDTLVESPVVSKWVKKSLQLMNKSSKEQGLSFKTVQLTPAWDDTFWINLLGRGYPFPRRKFRWCTDRLKIQPVNNFIKSRIAEHGEVILVLGTRKAESARRARSMEYYEKKRVRELLSPNPTLANELVFSPLADWTDDDVWIFLMQYPNPWGYSNMDLLTMYKGATADNECPLILDDSMPSCGKSRFGCWVCTMVERDKSMEAMIANDQEKEWMTPLLEFRNYFGDEKKDSDRREFRRMHGNLSGNYKKLFHGPYKKEVREEWIRRLLKMQKQIQENGPEEFHDLELIHIEELRAIRRIWVNEKHEFDDSLPEIYEEELGKPFDDPEWIQTSDFGKDEWKLLHEICNKEFPDEELMFEMVASMIDIENKSTGLDSRKDIIHRLDSEIGRTYYKNEADATEFYTNKNITRKEHDAKYREKFLSDYKKSKKKLTEDEDI